MDQALFKHIKEEVGDQTFKPMPKEEIEKTPEGKAMLIGQQAGLKDELLQIFVEFIAKSFPNSAEYYLAGWADDFKKGNAWSHADLGNRRVLRDIGYVDYLANFYKETMKGSARESVAEAEKNDKVFKPQSDKEIKAAGGNPKKARHGYGYYYFKLTMAGLGKDIGDAWNDAIEGFVDDPGDVPEEYEFEPEEE